MEAAKPHVDQFVTVTDAKNKLLDLIHRLKTRPEVVAITRDGVPAAALLSMDQFEGLMEHGDSQRPENDTFAETLGEAGSGRQVDRPRDRI